MSWHLPRWSGLASLLFLAGCGFVHDEVLAGPYRPVAIDISEDMSLCRSIVTQGDCSGDGLPEPTLFEAGADSRYIVFARHPRRSFEKAADRSVTQSYYIPRQADEWKMKRVSVMGPFNEFEYQQEKRRLQLPEFSRVFADLK